MVMHENCLSLGFAQAAATASSDPGSAWLGCIVASHAIMSGTVVEILGNIPSALACCRECRKRDGNTTNVCASGCLAMGSGCMLLIRDAPPPRVLCLAHV